MPCFWLGSRLLRNTLSAVADVSTVRIVGADVAGGGFDLLWSEGNCRDDLAVAHEDNPVVTLLHKSLLQYIAGVALANHLWVLQRKIDGHDPAAAVAFHPVAGWGAAKPRTFSTRSAAGGIKLGEVFCGLGAVIHHLGITILINHLAVTKPLLESRTFCWRGFGWLSHCSRLAFGGATLATLHKSASRQDVLLDDVGIGHLDVKAKVTQEVADDSKRTLDERQAGFGLSHDSQHFFRSFKHVLVVLRIKAILLSFGLHLSAAVLDHIAQHGFHLGAEHATQTEVAQRLVHQSLNSLVG